MDRSGLDTDLQAVMDRAHAMPCFEGWARTPLDGLVEEVQKLRNMLLDCEYPDLASESEADWRRAIREIGYLPEGL